MPLWRVADPGKFIDHLETLFPQVEGFARKETGRLAAGEKLTRRLTHAPGKLDFR